MQPNLTPFTALTCVSLHVAVQGRFDCKTLPTFITFVGSLSRMDPNVSGIGQTGLFSLIMESKQSRYRCLRTG